MALDKIKALLQKAGTNPELASQIVESMEEYKAKVVAESQEELVAKVKAAKTVVLEEVDLYKKSLARKVQLFCESKSQTIDRQLMRKSAAGETEAQAKLTGVKALLEGINLDGKPNSDLTAQLADAQNQLSRLGKQLTTTKKQAERSARIAENVMEKNQTLIKENETLQGAQLVEESTEAPTATSGISVPAKNVTVVSESTVEAPAKVITESVTPTAAAKDHSKATPTIVDTIANSMR